MRFVWERIKIVVEPSGAVAVAPLLNGKIDAGPPRRRHRERRKCRLTSYFVAARRDPKCDSRFSTGIMAGSWRRE